MSSLYDIPIRTLQGEETTLAEHKGKTLLVVNVASKCGLTPQYEGLEKLHEQYKDRGFSVIGVPCNQFGKQEPGSPEEIETFCSTTYGVTFPMTEKVDVNGPDRHPLYDLLVGVADNKGHTGDIQWNFEKFVISPEGEIVARFNPVTKPEDSRLVEVIEQNLPGEEG